MARADISIPQALIEKLRNAQEVTVLTGAGISAESGVPTFREAQTGLWALYNPQELATPQAFRRNPKLVWDWYTWRRELVAGAQPNPGHLALVEMEKWVPSFTMITQNVDNLHREAGSRSVIELHGNLYRFKCLERNHPVENWPESREKPPRCPHCGGMIRPDVVWFGESLSEEALDAAWRAAQSCQVMFSIGTSALVQPAASLPLVAHEAGATVVEVNSDRTPISGEVDFILKGAAGIVLPRLVRMVWGAP